MTSIRYAATRASIYLLLALAAGAVLFWLPMGRIEGWIDPVTSRLTILDPITFEAVFDPATGKVVHPLAPDENGNLRFRFSYVKYRDECEILNTQAMLDGDDRLDMFRINGTTAARVSGPQVSSIWQINIPTFDGVQMFFIHRCVSPWLVITKVFG